jgi:hypothetical protein
VEQALDESGVATHQLQEGMRVRRRGDVTSAFKIWNRFARDLRISEREVPVGRANDWRVQLACGVFLNRVECLEKNLIAALRSVDSAVDRKSVRTHNH